VQDEDDGCRVLVDRLWPRGIRKDAESVNQWSVDVAPSSQLRRWYGHKADRFGEFAGRYRDELRSGQASRSLDRLSDLARRGPLALLTASRDVAHSGQRFSLRKSSTAPVATRRPDVLFTDHRFQRLVSHNDTTVSVRRGRTRAGPG
jgi:uncharacterized protein YeaO (DUF488 family)